MDRILRLPVVMERTGLARSTIYKKIANKSFPAQRPLGAKCVGWLEVDIQNWIQSRFASGENYAE